MRREIRARRVGLGLGFLSAVIARLWRATIFFSSANSRRCRLITSLWEATRVRSALIRV